MPKKSSFITSVVTLVSGNLFAQVIRIGCIPIITRLFTVEDFGEFSVAFSVIAIVSSVSHGRLNVASMLPKSNSESFYLTNAAIASVLLVVGLLTAAYSLVYLGVSGFNLFSGYNVVLCVAIGCILNGLLLTFKMFYLRKGQIKRISSSQVAGALVSRIYIVVIGLCGFKGAFYLVLMKCMNDLIALITVHFGNYKNALKDLSKAADIPGILKSVVKFKDFPLYSITDLIIMLSMQLPTLLLGSYFGVTAVGVYSLAVRALREPIVVIGSAIGRIFYKYSTDLINSNKSIDRLFLHTIRICISIFLIPSIVFCMYAEPLFSFVFGSEWEYAGRFAQLMLPVFFMYFISSCIGTLFDSIKAQKQRFQFSLIQVLATFVSFYIGVVFRSEYLAILFVSFVTTIVLILRLKWVIGKMNLCLKPIVLQVSKIVLAGVLSASVFLFLISKFESLIVFCIAFILLLIVYLKMVYNEVRNFESI